MKPVLNIWPKTSAAFKCQGYRVDCPLNPKYSTTISMQKSFNQSVQFTKSFVRYTWFENPMIFKPSPIFDHAYPIIMRGIFSFHKCVSTWKRLAHFINSFEIQQNSEYQDVKGHANFWSPQLINYQRNF